jgi:hypothetical protein
MGYPFILARKRGTNIYTGVYVVGSGAWQHLTELKKKAPNNKEAIRWFLGTVPNRKWDNIELTGFSGLSILPPPTFNPELAGMDELQSCDGYYIINNGFDISFSCNKYGEKGCFVEYNTGTRANPIYNSKFIKINSKYTRLVQHRAGRGGVEILHLEKLGDEYELIFINEKGYVNDRVFKELPKIISDNCKPLSVTELMDNSWRLKSEDELKDFFIRLMRERENEY